MGADCGVVVQARKLSRTSETKVVDQKPTRTIRAAQARANGFRAELAGFNQVPPILTPGSGSFRARLAANGRSIRYQLSFSNLTSSAGAAHIHFGHTTDNGGIMAFLCGGGDKPACPDRGGTIVGTIEPEDVLAIPSQGLEAGDFTALLRIIRAGLAYVNVHTANFPDGEIRGQIRALRRA